MDLATRALLMLAGSSFASYIWYSFDSTYRSVINDAYWTTMVIFLPIAGLIIPSQFSRNLKLALYALGLELILTLSVLLYCYRKYELVREATRQIFIGGFIILPTMAIWMIYDSFQYITTGRWLVDLPVLWTDLKNVNITSTQYTTFAIQSVTAATLILILCIRSIHLSCHLHARQILQDQYIPGDTAEQLKSKFETMRSPHPQLRSTCLKTLLFFGTASISYHLQGLKQNAFLMASIVTASTYVIFGILWPRIMLRRYFSLPATTAQGQASSLVRESLNAWVWDVTKRTLGMA